MDNSPTHSPAAIRVGLVDDHIIVRAGLRQYFNDHPEVRVVGESASGRGAIDLVRTVPMDVLLLDIAMPGQSGLDAMSMLRAKAPNVAIVVLSSHPAEKYAVTMLRLGASAYLNKQCEPEEILEAVCQVAGNHLYLHAEVAGLLARQAGPKAREPHAALTKREFQVFLKLAQGARCDRIADELSLSPTTIISYRHSLLQKLDMRTDSELTYYAVKHLLID